MNIKRCLLFDVLGALLLGISVDNFAVHADFAPGGITGLAVICHYLFAFPIGLGTLLLNLPVILATFRRLGPQFFLMSLKTMVICAVFVDYIVIHLPVFTASRLLASVFAGICAGLGYALIFDAGSSTGGTDFIIVSLKRTHPKLTFGSIAFVVDGIIILLSVFVFHDILAFVYGMLYSLLASLFMDLGTWLLHIRDRQHTGAS